MTDLLPRDEYGMCRGVCHFWSAVDGITAAGSKLELQLECANCATIRIDTINARSGHLVSRRYDYPEDYQLHDVPRIKRPDKAAWRKEFIRTTRRRHG